jgi:hypothetical protein
MAAEYVKGRDAGGKAFSSLDDYIACLRKIESMTHSKEKEYIDLRLLLEVDL